MNSATKTWAALALAVGISSTAVLAHTGATGIVKERMDLMSDVGDRMKAIAAMVKGEAQFDAAAVKAAAEVMASHAAKVPELFPEGSTKHPSEALPEIWTDWDTFEKLADDMKVQAGALATAAESATDVSSIVQQFASVGKTCKSCHDKFRKP